MKPAYLVALAAVLVSGIVRAESPARTARPNIILILADDLGYSDLGCYGSEIATPNLDRLAAGGLRFSQFYNAARCCPSRAALLTGRFPHQVGVGHMGRDLGTPAYRGRLNAESVTVAEVLRQAGYRCLMSGKWHLGEQRPHFPIDHGFERYYGLLGGASSYFSLWPNRRMAIDDQLYRPDPKGFYMTDAITDRAIGYLDEYAGKAAPVFLYVAYTAPHAPLHAFPEDIARYRGKYRGGWDELRRSRYQRMIDLGILEKTCELSPRDPEVKAWDQIEDKDRQDLLMSVYAAQIDRMDRNIGRLMDKVRQMGLEQNTLVMFLSDNGGDSEEIDESKPGSLPGEPDSSIGYGRGWANVSNLPFRLHKRWVHEGGIATPLIAYWPSTIRRGGQIDRQIGHIVDILPTCLDAAVVEYPKTFQGRAIRPTEGISLLPTFQGKPRAEHECLYWEHEGNRAVRCGQWKLVAEDKSPWELYDMRTDRAESHDLAGEQPDKLKELARIYETVAKRWGVLPYAANDKPGRPGSAPAR